MTAMLDAYVPAHSEPAEMSVLGSMLHASSAADDVLGVLTSDDFYKPAHRRVFAAIESVCRAGSVADLVTVRAELASSGGLESVGGEYYLIGLMEFVPSPANALHYAAIVRDKALLRSLGSLSHEIARLAQDGDEPADSRFETVEQLVYSARRFRSRRELRSVRELAKDFFADVDQLNETGKPLLGVPCGFGDLNDKTGGFYRGELTILAARPAMGKTSLALNFALHAARQDKGHAAFFSLEMSGKQLMQRMAAMLSGVNSQALKRAGLSASDYHAMADACESVYTLPLMIDDTSDISASEITSKCRRLASRGGVGLVVIDYLQLMRGGKRAENRTQEVSELARSLKGLAKDLDVPVIALSQLSRQVEARENKRPQLSDLRESGSIEAEADVVMMIYRDDYYRQREDDASFDAGRVEVAELIIAKHRNGPTGKVLLGFQPHYARFASLSHDAQRQYHDSQKAVKR